MGRAKVKAKSSSKASLKATTKSKSQSKSLGVSQHASLSTLDKGSDAQPAVNARAVEQPVVVESEAAVEVMAAPSDGALSESFEEADPLGLLPKDVVAEEERLQQERAQAEAREAPALVNNALDTSRFAALEQLLQQSEAFVSYLVEKMKMTDVEDKLSAKSEAAAEVEAGAASAAVAEEEAPAPAPEGRKRKAAAPADEKACKRPEPKHTPTEPEPTPTQELLPHMKLELRDYQLQGVKWLTSIYMNGINGILADQMGLGKTAQTIGLLSTLKHCGTTGPFLVVAPLSTLPNWENEIKRFAGNLDAMVYHGTRKHREHLRAKRLNFPGLKPPADYPVIVTSYEILIADHTKLSKVPFKYLVVDEAHRLKNANGRLMRELKAVPADACLLLSGTPLQNNLSELWSLLNFLMPELFKDMQAFEAWFSFSGLVRQHGMDQEILADEQRSQMISKLHCFLRPFMLRRDKDDVNIGVPRKLEVVLYALMSQAQRDINQQLKDGTLPAKLAEQEGGRTSNVGKVNNMLMQMRKNCNHPDLITSDFTRHYNYPPPEELVEQCGKMQLLDRLLKRLKERKHKVLIFSQMVSMLDIIAAYAEQLGHRLCRLDGSLKIEERQANIDDFNTDEDAWLFLLSTRAGGLGLNLTAADTVIIYDSDWNPTQDMQAMDRCHRIGQTKPVMVFRLATAHSVEGRMLSCASGKMALERVVMKKGEFKEAPGMTAASVAKAAGLGAAELKEMLEADYKMGDLPQSGTVSEEMLEQLLDRNHLLQPAPADGTALALPFPISGVGYEVVQR